MVHDCEPFPWQQALVNRLFEGDAWPDVLDIPTGSGKTAALDAAVFHLALHFNDPKRAALRVVFIVDRRLVVDDAFSRAKKIADALNCQAKDPSGCHVLSEVARRLQKLAGSRGPALVAQRLRGGAPLEYDWARTPTQPTVLCSTVDQAGSRLLFRGYGVSDRMKPVHAGLLGTDSLFLLDEVHLSEPFRQTLGAVCKIGKAKIKTAFLSATPGIEPKDPFQLSASDRSNPVLKRRIGISKPVKLKKPIRSESDAVDLFALEALAAADRLRGKSTDSISVGVVVNRVALARDIYMRLNEKSTASDAGIEMDTMLMIGRSRDVDRDRIAQKLSPFRTGNSRRMAARSLFIVSTQCLEVGVDLDLDGLITQAASIDALRQRFGRLNRAGREINAEGAIATLSGDIARKADDPVYGDRIRLTWDALTEIAEDGTVDFGVKALAERFQKAGLDESQLAAEKSNAPVLMPAYLNLWSQTSPIPAADPDVDLFLHGTKRAASEVSIVWRDDIAEDLDENHPDLNERIKLMPPRSAEAIEIPIWAARRWLHRSNEKISEISDVPQSEASSVPNSLGARKVFRWAGADDPRTAVIGPDEFSPGDLLVVPVDYGGCDEYGWAPELDAHAVDVADKAAEPYRGQRFSVRISRNAVNDDLLWGQISAVLSDEGSSGHDLVNSLLAVLRSDEEEDEAALKQPERDMRILLEALRGAKGRIEVCYPYGDSPKNGAILVASRGLEENNRLTPSVPSTEDDTSSNTSGRPVLLEEHGHRVANATLATVKNLGLDQQLQNDLVLAARLHDAGKADPRFQLMLVGGDPWNRPEGQLLAKSSGISLAVTSHARTRSGLPGKWRHEALSVRMVLDHPDFKEAHDPALVLWLIGSHHGFGRPFFDFLDPDPQQPEPCFGVSNWCLPKNRAGPQSLSFSFGGADWPSLFKDLKHRYGIWGLAHLEAIIRLADHHVSKVESSHDHIDCTST